MNIKKDRKGTVATLVLISPTDLIFKKRRISLVNLITEMSRGVDQSISIRIMSLTQSLLQFLTLVL